MSDYGELLKGLIKFTDMKMSSVADIVGYDISYISKWCNKSKLPAARVASSVNRSLAAAFADEISEQGEIENFCREFSVSVKEEQLEAYIYTILKEAFRNSSNDSDTQAKKNVIHHPRVLVTRREIVDFITREFPQMLTSSADNVDVLCTLDICEFLRKNTLDIGTVPELNSQIRIKLGINVNNLSHTDYMALYSLINTYHYISFDFYENTNFKEQNLIVVKDKAAILCAIDQAGQISLAVVISDPEKVRDIYEKTEAAFKINHLLIMATTAREMMLTGYRSNFYAYGDFQMFLAKGCEFFLPLEMTDSITKSAREQGFDEDMETFFAKLMLTWEDIFSKEKADFFVLKSTLLKYLETGEIYFTDVMHRMSVDERKAHINHLLEMSKRNPKLNFYVIDEEKVDVSAKLMNFSLFNNHNKLFLKNINRFHSDFGPQFYSILNEKLINDISESIECIKEIDAVTQYSAESLEDFMDRYSGMIYRMLSLSELNEYVSGRNTGN